MLPSSTRDASRQEVLRRISRSVDYINTCYGHRLTIRSLAQAAALSQFHFIRLFKALHRMTPFAYLQRKRASVARRLLLQKKLNKEEIAAHVGFANRSTVYRQLRRLAIESPAALRGENALPQFSRRYSQSKIAIQVRPPSSQITMSFRTWPPGRSN